MWLEWGTLALTCPCCSECFDKVAEKALTQLEEPITNEAETC